MRAAILLLICAVVAVSAQQLYTAPANQAHYVQWSDDWSSEEAGSLSVVFNAQGNNDVHVALSDKQGVQRSDTMLEVVIGGWANSKSVLRVGTQGRELAAVVLPNLVSAKEKRTFWVNLYDGDFSAGLGSDVMDNVLLSVNLDDLKYPEPQFFSFGAWDTPVTYEILEIGNGIADEEDLTLPPTEKPIPKEAVKEIVYKVPGNYANYVVFPEFRVPASTFAFTFEAKGKNDFVVALSSERSARCKDCNEIVLGGWGNTRSVIRHGSLNAEIVAAATSNVCSESEFRTFWISYTHGHIAAGRGDEVGVNQLIAAYDPKIVHAHHIGLTAWNVNTQFRRFKVVPFTPKLAVPKREVVPEEPKPIVYTAPANFGGYVIFPAFNDFKDGDSFSFVFKAKTQNDIHILLSPTRAQRPADSNEIVIGGWANGRSVIRRGAQGSELGAASTYRICTAGEFSYYWVSFVQGGQIAFGKGDKVGQQTVLSVRDVSSKTVKFIGLGAWNVPVQFTQFKFIAGPKPVKPEPTPAIRKSTVYTAPANFGQYIIFPVTNIEGVSFSFVFRAKTQNDIHILLSPTRAQHPADSNEIVIGGWANARSVIRRGAQGPELAAASTPGICTAGEFSSYWVSFVKGGRIAFGKGDKVGQQTILAAQDPASKTVKFIGISAWNVPVQYADFDGFSQPAVMPSPEVKLPAKQSRVYVAPGNAAVYVVWPEAKFNSKKFSVTFAALAANDIHLLLSAEKSGRPQNSNEIVLGGWNNQQSVIRHGTQQHPPLTAARTPGIASTKKWTYFWVSFDNGFISVGYGKQVGKETFMFVKDNRVVDVKHIGLGGWNRPVQFKDVVVA